MWGYRDGWTGALGTEPDAGYTILQRRRRHRAGRHAEKERLDEFKRTAKPRCCGCSHAARRSGHVAGGTGYGCDRHQRLSEHHPPPDRAPGLALVGDAAMVGDPLWGTGCGWAMQSAEWLGDAVAGPFRPRGQGVDAGARRYQWRHRRQLLPHQIFTIDFSRNSRINPLMRTIYGAAARDQKVADRFAAVGNTQLVAADVVGPDAVDACRDRATEARSLLFDPQRL